MVVDIKFDIGRDILESIFVKALEGGSNYWYYLNNENYMKVSKTPTQSPAEAVFAAVYDKGIDIEIHDAENEEESLGIISRDTIAERLQRMIATGYSHHLLAEISEEGDAESSDVCFQFIVMGEYVFA